MALGQGTIFTADEAAKALRQNAMDYRGHNPWTDIYGSINLQTEQALGQLDSSYSKQLNEAYISAQQQSNAMRNNSLGQGFQELALQENEALLNQAFESYRNTYLQNKSQVEDTAAKYMGNIDSALMTQANNQAKLGNLALQYLPYLYEKDSTIFDNDVNYGRFLVDDGMGGKRLMSTAELTAKMADDNGLTDYGIDFLNMIEGYNLAGGNSFWDYVAEKDPDLFAWANAADPYNTNNRNVDTFRYLTGERKEGIWKPTESTYAGSNMEDIAIGMKEGYDALVTKYNEGHKSEDDATAFMTELTTQLDSLETYVKQSGQSENYIKKISDLRNKLTEYQNTITDPGKGNNRKNREWATSNALADYQALYNEIFSTSNAVIERTKNYEERKEANPIVSQGPEDVTDEVVHQYQTVSPAIDRKRQQGANKLEAGLKGFSEIPSFGAFLADPLWYISKGFRLQ